MTGDNTMLNETSLRRRLLFDSMVDPVAACDLLGLPGMSAEGVEMESADSTRRLAVLQPIMPTLGLMAQWTAETALAYQTEINGGDLPTDFQEQLYEMFLSVAKAALIAPVSVLIDMGTLTLDPEAANG